MIDRTALSGPHSGSHTSPTPQRCHARRALRTSQHWETLRQRLAFKIPLSSVALGLGMASHTVVGQGSADEAFTAVPPLRNGRVDSTASSTSSSSGALASHQPSFPSISGPCDPAVVRYHSFWWLPGNKTLHGGGVVQPSVAPFSHVCPHRAGVLVCALK